MEFYPIDIAIHLINIVVLFILLRIWLFKPVRKFMAQRQDRIAKQMDEAAHMQEDAKVLRADLDSQLCNVKDTCEKLISEGQRKASETAQVIVDNAETKARAHLNEVRQAAQSQRQQILDDAKVNLVDLAMDMAGRVLRFEQKLLANVACTNIVKVGSNKGVLKTAKAVTEQEMETMKNILENILACNLTLETEVDETLVGGFAAYIDGQVYDFSYAAQLSNMQRALN